MGAFGLFPPPGCGYIPKHEHRSASKRNRSTTSSDAMDFFSVAAVANYHNERLPTANPSAPVHPSGRLGGLAKLAALFTPSLVALFAWLAVAEGLAAGDGGGGGSIGLLTREVSGVPALALSSLLAASALLGGSGGEAGGALVLPAAVLWLDVQLDTVREVVLLCRSAGLTLLAVGLSLSRPRVVWRVVLVAVVGGLCGWALGVELLEQRLPQRVVLLGLVGVYLGTAAVYTLLGGAGLEQEKAPWEGWKSTGLLMGTSLVGGVLMSLCGFGLDLVVFMVMKLFFRAERKDAATTAVLVAIVVMLAGAAWRYWIDGGVGDLALSFVVSSLPMVIIAVPLGFLLGEYLFDGWFLPVLLTVVGFASSVLTLYKLQPWEAHDWMIQFVVFGTVLVVIVMMVTIAKGGTSAIGQRKISKSDLQRTMPDDARIMQDILGEVGSLTKQDSRQNRATSALSMDYVPSYVTFIEWVRVNGKDNVPGNFQ